MVEDAGRRARRWVRFDVTPHCRERRHDYADGQPEASAVFGPFAKTEIYVNGGSASTATTRRRDITVDR